MKIDFKTIAQPCSGEMREKASKFIGYAFPIETEEEAQQHVNELWKMHNKASHICYAYRLGVDGEVYRINDDGEPSGTAGKPIHGQLLSYEVTDVLLCIVRYFGGTKLGASGLISAYKESAKICLEEAVIIDKSLSQTYLIQTNYEQMGVVMNTIKDLDINILTKEFNEDVHIVIAIPMDVAAYKVRQLKAGLLNYEMNRITDETEVPNCKFVELIIVKS